MKKSRKVNPVGKFKPGILLAVLLLFGLVNIHAQDVLLEKQISMPEFQGTVKEALDEISKKGGFYFSFSNEIRTDKWVRLKPKQQSVMEFLDELLDPDKVRYVEKKNKIILLPKKPEADQQKITRSVRGRIIDKDTRLPLLGVNIVVASNGPLKGAVTNENGEFTIDKVTLGRHDIRISCVGYQKKTIPNILVSSGKESILYIELVESVTDIREVTIRHEPDKIRPLNDLAVISSRSFTAEETNYCPGAIGDISRVAVSYPGVFSRNDGQNHLIIRGNSPKGLQWRLEGIEIPNLNHFAEIGSSGGGVSILSNNMMSISDFLTGAFPAEYGNALSGVFDLNIRKGNNHKHEQTFQVGMIGTEFMAEGPLKKESGATYIGQYRYSTLELVKKLGIDLESVPEMQDLSFKLHLPTKKMGTFTVFGIGGMSHEAGASGYDWHSNMGTMGISNSKILDSKTYIKSILAFSGWNYRWDEESNIGTAGDPVDYQWLSKVTEFTTRLSVSVNRKINARHKVKTGIIINNELYDSYLGWRSDTLFNRGEPNYEQFYSDAKGNANTLQAYASWKYAITDNLTVNPGIHYIRLFLNDNYSVEPRLGIQWNFLKRHTLSAGFGIHSRKESMSLYTGTKTLFDGAKIHPNVDLELTKAQHYVLGYRVMLTPVLQVKLEGYYQYLYDIPVYPFPPYFSTINFDWGFEGNILVNEGTAYNKGVELTVEKFFSDGYYLMVNGTLYESKFRNYQGREYNTKYNGSHALGVIFLKEFKVGRNGQHILGFGNRLIYTGGFRDLPIDLQASREQNRQVEILDYGFTEKMGDFMRVDLQINFRRNKPRYTGEWRVDILNLFNRKNPLDHNYDAFTRQIETDYQNPIIAVIAYRIQF